MTVKLHFYFLLLYKPLVIIIELFQKKKTLPVGDIQEVYQKLTEKKTLSSWAVNKKAKIYVKIDFEYFEHIFDFLSGKAYSRPVANSNAI